MSRDEAIEILYDMRDEYNLFGDEKEATRYHVLSWAIHEMKTEQLEIIRCKDCRWGRKVCGNIECSVDSNIPPEYHGYNWFCPNGERRRG